MKRRLCIGRACGIAALAVALAALGANGQQAQYPQVEHLPDGSVVVNGGEFVFESWGEYVASGLFANGLPACGTPNVLPAPELRGGGADDCTFGLTNPNEAYDPSVILYRIPVVVHVIRDSGGVQGHISEDKVQQQIDMLNEDFMAITGSPGEGGTDVQIEFFLAQHKPDGAPTNGITYSNNSTWYADGGSYWNTLAWDTNRYLNIYTNGLSPGLFGYVPGFPQSGLAGNPADRVVVKSSVFALSNTTTHEVGHYFGLFHTFQGSCGTTSCYSTGDLICDTNPQFQPTWSCFVSSCGSEDPYTNYMDYSDDFCQTGFTADQARRMRCTLEFYRPDVFIIAPPRCGDGILEYGEGCEDSNEEPGDGCSAECWPEKNFLVATSCATHGAAGQICTVLPPCGIEPRLSATSRLRVAMTGTTFGATATADCGSGPIAASGIINGNPLVADFDPPLPKGEVCTITLGGDAVGSFSIRHLGGDVNLSGTVDTDDLSAIKNFLGTTVNAATARYDVQPDGFINTADITYVKPHLGSTAPSCP